MIEHEFVCDKCDITIIDSDTKNTHYCSKCGGDMRWNLRGVGIADGDYNHISDSLAISPDQIAEHRGHFPNIDVLSDGRLHFTSVKQQSKYLDATGFYKHPQKIKNLGKVKVS